MNSQTRIRKWLHLVAFTGAAQLIVQAVGFFSGILIIRLLPVHEYALYTLANTMLGTMAILADGGIAAGVMTQGGKVWRDRQKMGAVLATGMDMRRKFAAFSLLVAVPTLFYLLRKHEASWLMSALIVLSLVPTFFYALAGTLLQIPPKLHQDIKSMQRYQVEANLGRLVLSGLTLFVFPCAAIAIVCAGASQVWNNWRLKQLSVGYADISQPVDAEVRRNIADVVKRVMPGAIYYCFSSQITVWLASVFGTTESVAQLGALSRLMMGFNIIGTIFGILIVPRFSRLPDNKEVLLAKFCQTQALLLLVSILIMAIVFFTSDILLWVLGDSYGGLNYELMLSAGAGCMALLCSSTFLLCSNRGYIISPIYNIGISFISQGIFLWLIGYSSMQEVLALAIAVGVVQYIMWLVYFLVKVEITDGLAKPLSTTPN